MSKLKRIIIHWDAGHGEVTPTALEHYHYVVDRYGLVHTGKHSPEANEDCKDGVYAQHTGGGNTGSIGVAICGMCSYNSKLKKCEVATDNITQKGMESLFAWVAYLCKKYSITNKNVITHAEFGKSHPDTTSKGKIDITAIPYAKVYGVKECGDYIRNKVQWYYERIK